MTFVLIASEFMPVSLLTPIATDLGITEGQAEQAIAVSGFFAVITSLFGNRLLGRLDRRIAVLLYTLVMIGSGLVVTFAPNGPVFMLGRALIGVTIGGFWSLTAAILVRIVGPAETPKAMAMLQSGTALATVIAAPLGSFLGAFIGWRGAFFIVVPVGLAALVWQWLVLPSLPASTSVSPRRMLGLLWTPRLRHRHGSHHARVQWASSPSPPTCARYSKPSRVWVSARCRLSSSASALQALWAPHSPAGCCAAISPRR